MAATPVLKRSMSIKSEMYLDNHNQSSVSSIAYLTLDKNRMILISGSKDGIIRLWDPETGMEFQEARYDCNMKIKAVATSRDGRLLASSLVTHDTRTHDDLPGDLIIREVAGVERSQATGVERSKATGVVTRAVETFEGQTQVVNCVDISPDNKLLVSGSQNGEMIIWPLDNGAAYTFKTTCPVGAVRFSSDSTKLAARSDVGKCLEIWDIVQKRFFDCSETHDGGIVTYAPMFWTKDDKSIVTPFSFKDDRNAKKIYEFDPSTLKQIGEPFRGHDEIICGLAISLDGALLASTSKDDTIKLWQFESRQILASINVERPDCIIFPPTGSQYVAYTCLLDFAIYVSNIAIVPPVYEELLASEGHLTLAESFDLDDLDDEIFYSSRSTNTSYGHSVSSEYFQPLEFPQFGSRDSRCNTELTPSPTICRVPQTQNIAEVSSPEYLQQSQASEACTEPVEPKCFFYFGRCCT